MKGLMKGFYVMAFSFLHFTILLAQEVSCDLKLKGKVTDEHDSSPLAFSTIWLLEEEKGTSADVNGEYKIEGLCPGEYRLVVSHIGCASDTILLKLSKSKEANFQLEHHTEELKAVEIEVEKAKEEGTKSIAQITIDKADIRTDPTQSLAASLANETGVTLASTGSNVEIPVIHGLYGNRVLTLNNGLKHGFQNWSRDHAPEIDVSSANSITVLKGASGVRFGPEALGGAIIVESNALHLNEPFYSNLSTGYQTNGRGVFTTVEAGQGFERWSYYLNGNYTKIGDRHSPTYVLSNSGKEETSLGFGTRYHYKNLDVKFHYSYVDQNLALLRSSVAESGTSFIRAINSDEPIIINSFSYDIKEPNQQTLHHFGKLEMSWYYSDHNKLTFRAGRQLNQREEFDVRRNADRPIIDLDLITSDYQLEWKHTNWFGLDGLIGVQYFGQENSNNPGTGTTAFIPNYVTDRYSAFLIENKKFGENILELGLRLDYENNRVIGRETSQAIFRDEYDFSNLTASIGYVKKISDNASFRTNVGTAWRIPNMAELFSFGQQGFKTSFGLLRYDINEEGDLRTNRVIHLDASNVEAEKGYKLINELQVNKDENTHTIILYSHYIQNYIFDRPYAVIGTIRGPMPVFIFDQADALFAGVDYSWKRDWSQVISGELSLSYLWSLNVGENQSLINQAPIRLNFDLNWHQTNLWKFESSTLSLHPSYTFQQFQAPSTVSPESLIDGSVDISEDDNFDFADAPDGYFLLDLSWTVRWQNLSGSISVVNALNNSYRNYLNEMRYFADEPGRNIRFTLNYFFKTKKVK